MVVVNEEVTTKFDHMSNKELGAYIRAELKKIGLNNRMVSVSVKDCGYSTSVTCTVKDLSIDLKTVENIANAVEYVRYDGYAQEILAGCNRFVEVKYDWKVKRDAQMAQMENAKKIVDENIGHFFYTDENETRFHLSKDEHSNGKDTWTSYSIWKFEKGERCGSHVQSNMGLDSVYCWLAYNLALDNAKKSA